MSQSLQKRETALNGILEVARKVGLVTLIISIFSSLSFLITYSFLYGYYFGGDTEYSFSNFELIRVFIPFDINTILFTYLMIGLSVTLLMYIVRLFFSKDIFVMIGVLILCVVFHIILTAFFTKDLTAENIIKFSVIWIFPLFMSMLVLFLIRGIKNTFKVAAGALFGFSLYVLIISFSKGISEYSHQGLILLIIIIFAVIFTYFPFNKLTNVLFVLPFTFLFFLIIASLVPLSFFQNFPEPIRILFIFLFIIVTSYLLSIVFMNFFRNKETNEETMQITNSFNKTMLDISGELLNPKTHKKATVFLIIFVLGVYVLLPRVATSTAKVIREYTPDTELQFYTIQVLTPDGTTETIDGIVVAEKNDTLYIANKDWELQQIKTNQYYIE